MFIKSIVLVIATLLLSMVNTQISPPFQIPSSYNSWNAWNSYLNINGGRFTTANPPTTYPDSRGNTWTRLRNSSTTFLSLMKNQFTFILNSNPACSVTCGP